MNQELKLMAEIVKKKLKYELGIEVDATHCEKKL